MCGFAGIVYPVPATDYQQIVADVGILAGSVAHRGPDDSGAYADAEAGIGLGHRRLAIHDLSPEGRQPMSSPCGRWTLVFNGEVYNFQALRQQLGNDGWTFRSRTDTEVLLAAIARWGVDTTLRRCHGLLAMAVWDREARLLTLARDRLGKKPLYMGWAGGAFLFGSELRVLEAHGHFEREIDPAAAWHYFRFGYVPAPQAIYRSSWKLPPACRLSVRLEDLRRAAPNWPSLEARMQRYWSPPTPVPFAKEVRRQEISRRASVQLRKAVSTRLCADVPVGVFLSGGIDSTAIATVAQQESSGPLTTLTLGFEEPEFDESESARRVAERIGSHHISLTASAKDALEVIPELNSIYDEPFADSSQVAMALLSRFARDHVTVVLTGDGGDEVFGGYNRHRWVPQVRARAALFPRWLRGSAAGLCQRMGALPWHRGPLSRSPIPLLSDKLVKLGSILEAPDNAAVYDRLISIWSHPPIPRPIIPSPLATHLDSVGPALDDPFEFSRWMMARDLIGYLPGDLMVKLDRATMAYGLEARSPLLDHQLIETVWSDPGALRDHPREGKRFLLDIVGESVPRDWLSRPKSGFAVPIGRWMQGPLREWAEPLIHAFSTSNLPQVEVALISTMWQRNLDGDFRGQYRLWSILQFQSWRDQRSATWPSVDQAVA